MWWWPYMGDQGKQNEGIESLPPLRVSALSGLALVFTPLPHVAEKLFINSLGSIIPRILSPQAKRKN